MKKLLAIIVRFGNAAREPAVREAFFGLLAALGAVAAAALALSKTLDRTPVEVPKGLEKETQPTAHSANGSAVAHRAEIGEMK